MSPAADGYPVPTLRDKKIRGWPKFPNGGEAKYGPLADALTLDFPTDAHFAAYSVPAIRRRLILDALRKPEARAQVPDGVPMVAVLFDVDCPAAHAGDPSATDAWWIDEQEKIAALRSRHVDAFVYRTRGGYRIVYIPAVAIVLREDADAEAWSLRYCSWIAYLAREFEIVADASCKDWTRLYRAPHATRDEGGRPERRETIGDPSAIGTWTAEPSAEDAVSARKMHKKRARKEERADDMARPSPVIAAGDGVLVHLFRSHGWLGDEVEPGKWKAACPNEASHTKGERFDDSTVLFGPSPGESFGWLHCSHAHCQGRGLRDLIALFTEDEVGEARRGAGLAATPAPDTTRDDRRSQGHHRADDRDLAGKALAFEDPEPWPDPVDGATLLESLSSIIKRYLILPSDHALVAVILWIVHTWTWEAAAEFSPRLIVTGPKKRCGKSRLFEVIAPLVRRALLTASLTLAAMFRILDEHQPSILIDEFDALSDDLREALRGVLNAGQRRGGVVHRCAGDDHEVRAFAVFGPVAVAGIGKMPDTVEDRGIRVGMRRKTKKEKVGRLRKRRFDTEVAETTRRICRWAKDHEETLADREPSLPEALDDRAADGWEALLAVADEVGGDWPRRAREAAVALSSGRDDTDDALDTMLLADVRDLFETHRVDRLASERLADLLGAMKQRPWALWGKVNPKPISANAVARLLKPFEIRPTTIRLDVDTQKGYMKAWFEDAFARYLPTEPSISTVTPSQEPIDPSGNANAKDSPNVTRRDVTDADSFDFPRAGVVRTQCDGVTDGNDRSGAVPTSAPCPCAGCESSGVQHGPTCYCPACLARGDAP